MLWHNCKWFIALIATLMLIDCTFAENITCIECDDADDCLKNVAAVKITCSKSTSCFTKINGDGKVSRGCVSNLDPPDCSGESCTTCNKANCNNNNICKTCDSSSDARCAQTAATDVKAAICAKADTKCMISVLESKTVRGCVTDDFEKKCTDDKKCKMCDGSICNVGIFPTDRLLCHQCNETDATCANAPSSSSHAALPCLLQVENDKCYMYGSDAMHITRGCTSDADTTNKCAKSDDAKCKTCTTNNCNEWTYEVDQALTCITCTSKDNNGQCAWGQTASNAKSCEKKILYSAESKCYTRTENDVVTRGCFYDLDEAGQAACTEGKNCTVCSGSGGCNNVDAKDFTCMRCRSDNDASCSKEIKGMGGLKCRHVVESDADAKCFAGVWNNGVVIRGCFIDLEIRDQFTCNSTDNKSCYVCDGANCNTKDPHSAAAHVILTNGLLAFVLLTFCSLK